MAQVKSLHLRDVDLEGRHVDVVVRDGRVAAFLPPRSDPLRDADVIEGHAGALLPGLHDHHLHLLSLAASANSIRCTWRESRESLVDAIRTASDAEIRVVGYHEQTAGLLDRWTLDAIHAERPVRVQHHSGALWMLNSAALTAHPRIRCGLEGVECDDAGVPTGRLWRADHLLHSTAGGAPPPLRAVGRALARHGITGVTDATPDIDSAALETLAGAHRAGELPQRVTLLGIEDDVVLPAGFERGPRKLLLHDHSLPDEDRLAEWISRARDHDRAVAVHCVSIEALALTLRVLDRVGGHPGDRIEHGSMIPPQMHSQLRRSGAVVITQPGFVRDRGDRYLQEISPAELSWLYPHQRLLAAGIPVAVSSDAPFGDLDPWMNVRTAHTRRTGAGAVIGPAEAVSSSVALRGYLTAPDDPGGPTRRVSIGAPADLCLLRGSVSAVLDDPEPVRLTVIGGRIVYDAVQFK